MDETRRILEQSTDPVALAQAHVYRAIALGCTGDVKGALDDLQKAEAGRDLLDSTSRQILAQLQLKGVPRNPGELQTILAVKIRPTLTLSPP